MAVRRATTPRPIATIRRPAPITRLQIAATPRRLALIPLRDPTPLRVATPPPTALPLRTPPVEVALTAAAVVARMVVAVAPTAAAVANTQFPVPPERPPPFRGGLFFAPASGVPAALRCLLLGVPPAFIRAPLPRLPLFSFSVPRFFRFPALCTGRPSGRLFLLTLSPGQPPSRLSSAM